MGLRTAGNGRRYDVRDDETLQRIAYLTGVVHPTDEEGFTLAARMRQGS